MVNYDLPWNPNRLEQRFGRIHRIGQTEVCHLWNLVAGETREGAVYQRLLKKLEAERHALDGQVFDVLGKLFQETPLRKLLVDAVRYGDDPAVRARLEQAIDNATDRKRVRDLLEHQSLVSDSLSIEKIVSIREEMERASARRLQPFYIKAFFLQAFDYFGGTIYERESGRYAINNVPAMIRNHAKQRALGAVSTRYERICFEKALINVPSRPAATFVCPGHPLLDATISLMLDRERDSLKRGGVLVDETDPGQELRALFYLEQSIQDATPTKSGERRTISREVHFVEIDSAGSVREAGGAPYLDYRPATAVEVEQIAPLMEQDWLKGEALERRAAAHAVEHLVPRHLERVRARRIELIDKTEAAVQERLAKEINYWDLRAGQLHIEIVHFDLTPNPSPLRREGAKTAHKGCSSPLSIKWRGDLGVRFGAKSHMQSPCLRAADLRSQEKSGKINARLNSQRAQERGDRLAERLKQRKAQLAQERQIFAAPPVVVGGALIIPIGLQLGERTPADILDTRITEQIAMRAVIDAEIALGNDPRDVSAQNVGCDVESRDWRTGRLRFIEVKGRRAGAETVTVTHNEIMTCLNAQEQFILALVEIDGQHARPPRYVRQPFTREPDSNVTSVNYNLHDLLAMSEEPR